MTDCALNVVLIHSDKLVAVNTFRLHATCAMNEVILGAIRTRPYSYPTDLGVC